MIHDLPTPGHGGSDSFAAFILGNPDYGRAARQGIDALHRLLGERGINMTRLDQLDPQIDYRGTNTSVASIDSYGGAESFALTQQRLVGDRRQAGRCASGRVHRRFVVHALCVADLH